MRILSAKNPRDQRNVGPSAPLHAPIIWPWILVFAAWTLVLLAGLSKQTFMINHNYLLTQSHLP